MEFIPDSTTWHSSGGDEPMIQRAERRNQSAARWWCLASSESASASPVGRLSSWYQRSAGSQLMEREEVRGTRSPRQWTMCPLFVSPPPASSAAAGKCAWAASCLHPVHAWAACRQIFGERRTSGRGEVEQRYIKALQVGGGGTVLC